MVQGRNPMAGFSDLKAQFKQDMHYAEFAEDEVRKYGLATVM